MSAILRPSAILRSSATLWRAARIEARLDERPWAWAQNERAAIEANWARRLADKPAMFDGPVLLARDASVADGVARLGFLRARFADLLAFRDFGFPAEARALNAFAAAALRTRDGAYLLGRMGAHTANAGQVYFPCGSPDLDDLRADGTVDLAGSARRELAEETGLVPDAQEGWTIVREEGFLACLLHARLDADAEEARARALAHCAREAVSELADVVIVRGPADVDPARVPSYARTFLAQAFATQPLSRVGEGQGRGPRLA